MNSVAISFLRLVFIKSHRRYLGRASICMPNADFTSLVVLVIGVAVDVDCGLWGRWLCAGRGRPRSTFHLSNFLLICHLWRLCLAFSIKIWRMKFAWNISKWQRRHTPVEHWMKCVWSNHLHLALSNFQNSCEIQVHFLLSVRAHVNYVFWICKYQVLSNRNGWCRLRWPLFKPCVDLNLFSGWCFTHILVLDCHNDKQRRV